MWFVFRVNFDTTGKQSNSTQTYDNETAAFKRFYNVLAADIDSDNYVFELVQVVRDDGIVLASQVFDNRNPQGV